MENANDLLAFEAGRNATDDASGNDILTRYRQLVAQKSASKAYASCQKTPACSESDASSISDPERERFVMQDLGSDLDAEIEGCSDKENVDPMPSAATAKHGAKIPSRDTVAKILGSIGGSYSSASTSMLDGDESAQMNMAVGKLFVPPEKALEDQWAMVGERDDDSEEVAEESDLEESGKDGVQQDPGELLSTGILDASYLDSSAGQISLDLSWKAEPGILSPVNENTDSFGAIKDLALSKSVATFSPQDTSTTKVGATPARVCFVKWNEPSDDDDGASADVSALRDTSVMISESSGVLTDDEQGSQEDGDEDEYPQGSLKQQQLLHASIEASKYPETPKDQGVAPLSPLSSLRKDAMEQALEESQVYMSKICELTSAKDAAETKARGETKRRRQCEKRIGELLNLGRGYGGENDGPTNGMPLVGTGAEDLNRSIVISPVSKSSSAKQTDDPDALATSLMERNKTLVKEVRFADQTCVELAERNSALQNEVERLNESLTTLKKENGSLHEGIVKSSQHGAQMKESRSNLAAQISDQKERYETQLSALRAKATESDEAKSSLIAQLAASIARADTLQERLSMKVVANGTKAEDASFGREEIDRVMADRESLRLRCSDLEAQVVILRQESDPDQPITPQKTTEESSPLTRTPTSTLLARTLQSELQRGYSVNNRVIEAEKSLAEANTKLESLRVQLEVSHANKSAAQDETKIRLCESLREIEELKRNADAARGTEDLYDNDSDGETPSQELVCTFCMSEDAHAVSTDKVTYTDEVVDLRSQLHKVLFENKALLIEVSSYKASIKKLKSAVEESRQQCFSYQKKHHDATNQLEQLRDEKGPAMDGDAPGQELVCTFGVSEDANAVSTDKMSYTDEVVDLRSQLHKVLFENKALLIEVSSYEESIKELKAAVEESRHQCFSYQNKHHDATNQLEQLRDKKTPSADAKTIKEAVSIAVRNIMESYRTVQNEADGRLYLQQQRVALLSDTILHLQSQLDFQTISESDDSATLSSAGMNASLSNCVDADSPEKVLDVVEFQEEDNVLNATFTGGRATNACESTSRSLAEGNSMEELEEARVRELGHEQSQDSSTDYARTAPQDDDKTLAKLCQMQDELHAKEESLERAEIEKERLSGMLDAAKTQLQASLERAEIEKERVSGMLDAAKTQLQAEKESSSIRREMYSQEKVDLLSCISELEGKLELCERGRMQASELAASAQESKYEENDNLREEIEELRSKLGMCSDQYQDSQSELESFRIEAADMLNDLELRKEALEKENKVLNEELEDLRSRIECQKEEDREKAISIQKSAEAELRKASDELEGFRTEAADMLNNLELQKEALGEENKVLNEELKELRSKIKCQRKNEDNAIKFQVAAQSAETELRKASGEVLLTRATMSKLQAENKRLSSAAEQSNREHESVRSGIQSATEKAEALEKERSKLLEDIDRTTAERTFLTKQCEDHVATIEKYKSLRFDDAKVVEDLRAALNQTTAQTNELKHSYVTVNDKLANAMERNFDSESTIQDAQERIRFVEKERDEKQRSATQHKEELIRVQHELTAVRSNAQRLFSEQDLTIRELKDMNEEHISERDTILKEAEEALGCLQQEITALSTDMRYVASKLCVKDDVVHRALGKAQEGTNRPRSNLLALRPHAQDQKQTVVSDAFDTLLQLRAVIAGIDDKLSEHNALMLDLDLEKQRLASEVTAHFRTEEELKVELAEGRDRERRVEGRLKKATQEIESQAAKLSVAELTLLKSKKSIANLEGKLVSTMEGCERLREERDSDRTTSTEHVSKAEEELKRRAEELSKITLKHASLERKCERLRDYIKSLTQKCEEWAESYRSQSTDLSRTKQANETLEDKISQMKALVEGCEASACSECRHLRSAIAAKCEVRAALLSQDTLAVRSISWQVLKPSS